jgi:hypothetical protein
LQRWRVFKGISDGDQKYNENNVTQAKNKWRITSRHALSNVLNKPSLDRFLLLMFWETYLSMFVFLVFSFYKKKKDEREGN